MTQEDKQLLLKDLCARLPYGFTIHRYSDNRDITFEPNELDEFAHFLEYSEGEEFKPYLRPLSSMTEKEQHEYDNLRLDNLALPKVHLYYPMRWHTMDYLHVDWLNERHFDYRIDPSTGKTLIESGLALEALKGMYKTE